MFDFIRSNMRVMQLLLFILIVPAFVLFGVEGYSRFGEGGEAVARVDGQDITQVEWDNAHRMQVERLRQQMPTLDAKLLDSPEARYGTLEGLVRERVLAAAVADSNLLVADQRVARELQENELVRSLRGPDGKLDIERYRQLLGAQGLTPETYENQVRYDLGQRQVMGGIAQSAFAPQTHANVALDSYFGRREAQVARFAAADYRARVEPTDAQLQAFYKENPQLFQAPEQANIEYAVLDLGALQGGAPVNEADLRAYYEQNTARLAGQEQRRASHILVAVPQGAPDADKQKARARAEELLAQVRRNPDSFAAVAQANSQDPGSAPQGGDLDFFTRGAMTKPFEDAVFALKEKGEISGIVETEFGLHIIRLTDVKAQVQRSFDEMRPELEAQLRREEAQKRYAEAAENFSNTVYEQPDSLAPVVEKLKLQVRTAQGVTRTPAPGATGPLANPKFLEALFAPDSVERKRNTEAVEFGPNQMVSGRITQHTPARARPFEEVKAQVREQVVAREAAELAKKEGQARLAAWQAAPASAQLPPPTILSRQGPGQQPRPVIEAALRADPARLPAFIGVDLGAEGYAVVKVNQVLPREAPVPQQAQQELQQYTRAWASAESEAYYAMLKERFKAQIKVPRPRDALTQ